MKSGAVVLAAPAFAGVRPKPSQFRPNMFRSKGPMSQSGQRTAHHKTSKLTIFARSRSDVCGNLPNSGRNEHELGRSNPKLCCNQTIWPEHVETWRKQARSWSESDHIWSKPANIDRTQTNVGELSSKLVERSQVLAEPSPNLAVTGNRPTEPKLADIALKRVEPKPNSEVSCASLTA